LITIQYHQLNSPSNGSYVFKSPQMDLQAFLVAIWEPSNGDQICFSRPMATNFGRGFLKVYEF
jgi:hypothetical protein